MSAIYLEATTALGVTQIEDLDKDMDFIEAWEFLEALPLLEDGEVIRTIITHTGEPEYIQIRDEYGIN